MRFLSAIAAFLACVWLAWYVFVTLENTVLGLAAVALMGVMMMVIIISVKEDT